MYAPKQAGQVVAVVVELSNEGAFAGTVCSTVVYVGRSS